MGRPDHGIETRGRDVLAWMWQRAWGRLPKPPQRPIRGVTPDIAYLHANRSDPAFTWIGHASALLQVGGANLLFDPVFSKTASPFRYVGPRRHQPPGLQASQLPPIDAVLLTHNHYDHLDRASVRTLARQAGGAPRYIVPRGTESWFARNLPRVRGALPHIEALDWHASTMLDAYGITTHYLPVQHWSNRTGFDRNQSLWGSFAIVHPSFRFWFSGDLGYSHAPSEIGERYGPFDAAAIAIGAYEPRWFMRQQHVNPEEAVQVMLDVRAAHAIGIHWGTFALTDEPLDQPPRDLAAAVARRGLPPEQFVVIKHGETRRLSRKARAHPQP
ncbi:MBL fold metallo-hydrolase [Gemmatimonas sp.]